MQKEFNICGTRIPFSLIKDFRIINVEYIFRPVFCENKKSMLSLRSNKQFQFSHMEPYAAIVGQQGQKSELGNYRPKDFKEALGKDLSGPILYTIADKFKLKAFKREKYQCINLAGRPFSTYLDDVPVKIIWSDGRIAEVYREDELYTVLNEMTTPGISYVDALVVKTNETFCFYGEGIQVENVNEEYERLKKDWETYNQEKNTERKKIQVPFLRGNKIENQTSKDCKDKH